MHRSTNSAAWASKAGTETRYFILTVHTMKVHGGTELQLHWFLLSVQSREEWSAQHPRHFVPGEWLDEK